MDKLKRVISWYIHSWLWKPTLYLLGLIAIIILFDQLIMPYYVKLGHERELPDVVEMTADDAITLLESQDFKVIIKDSLYDANHPAGVVIEQNPYPFSTVKEGRRVYLSVSIGEKPIIMPKLIGLSPRDAELRLQAHNLVLFSKNYAPSDMYLEGTVIGQSYPQGQQIKPGSRISITISLGRLREKKVIPDLVGKSVYAAREELKRLGITVGEITYEKRTDILPETIISQSLAKGSPYSPGDIMNLVVSRE